MNEEELEGENVLGDAESETESTINESADQATKEDENITSDEVTEAEKVEFHEFDDVEKTNIDSSNNLDMLKDVNVEVSVELGRITMPLGDVLNLSKGSVVELENLAGEQINVLVNGLNIAMGEVVVIGEHFGVRISKLISTKLKNH
jgi:flagellar motor switch protein FliN/FliY